MATPPEEMQMGMGGQTGEPPEFSDLEAILNRYTVEDTGEDTAETPAEQQGAEGEPPATEQPTATENTEGETPTEQPTEEEPPATEDTAEQVQEGEEQAQEADYLQTVADSVLNGLQLQEGATVTPEIIKQAVDLTAQALSDSFNAQLGEIKKHLAENDEAFSLLKELSDVEKEQDWGDHKEYVLAELKKQEKVSPGDYKRLLTSSRASKYKPTQAVLDEALKDEAKMAEFVKNNPALKKVVENMLMTELKDSNGEIPTISPPTGAPYREPPKAPPKDWNEAEKSAHDRLNRYQQSKTK